MATFQRQRSKGHMVFTSLIYRVLQCLLTLFNKHLAIIFRTYITWKQLATKNAYIWYSFGISTSRQLPTSLQVWHNTAHINKHWKTHSRISEMHGTSKTQFWQYATHFRVKEDFWPKKSFIADIDSERLFRDGVLAFMNFEPLGWLRVVLSEFFDNVRTNVRVLLLNK